MRRGDASQGPSSRRRWPGTWACLLLACLLLACAVLLPAPVRRACAGERPAHAGLLARDLEERRGALGRLGEQARLGEPLAPEALQGLEQVLQRDAPPERALAAALLVALPGTQAALSWAQCLDPAHESDERVWAAALDAAGQASDTPALARILLTRLKQPRLDPLARALALEGLGAAGGVECDAWLRPPATGQGEPWLEAAARARALARRPRTPERMALLLDLLAHSDLAVRVQAHESLVALSGQALPMDLSAWQRLLEEASAQSEPPVPSASGDRYASPHAPHVPHYYGIPIPRRLSRVVFCLDVSQSMYGHGIDEARAELTRAIQDLPSEHAFEIVAFNENVLPWSKRLVRAHPVQKARALAWLAALEPTSYTNLYDAVELAFGHAGIGRQAAEHVERLDAVFLLSDGAPNRGRHRTQEAVVRHIERLSERRIPVHAIGAGEEVFPLLRAIAAATGGLFVDAFR